MFQINTYYEVAWFIARMHNELINYMHIRYVFCVVNYINYLCTQPDSFSFLTGAWIYALGEINIELFIITA
jgi:hypothetical protein